MRSSAPRPLSDHEAFRERGLETESSAVLVADGLSPGRPLVYANPAFERITGYTAIDVLGRGSSFIHGEQTDPAAVAELRQAEESGRPASRTLLCYRKDGSTFWAEHTVTPIEADDGRTTHLVHVLVDLTERQSIATALHASEARFRVAFEDAAIGIALSTPSGRFFSVNRAFCDITGYAEDALLELRFQAITHPDDLDADVRLVGRLLAGDISSFRLEKRYVKPDGGMPWVRLHVSLVRDADGEPAHFVSLIEDITERKRAEEALRESEDRFRGAFENAAVGVALVAPDGRFLRANQALCDLLGYSPAELLALDFQAVTHPDDLARDLDLVGRTLTGEIESYQLEKRYIRSDGDVAWGRLNVSLVRDGRGAPLHFVSQIEDVTDRMRAQQALADSEKRFRGAFDAGPIGMALVSPEGRYLRVNQALCELLGYSQEELLATTFQAISHPSEVARNTGLLARALAGEIDSYRLETRYIHKDGHDVWGALTASVVRNQAGRPEYLVSEVVDITDRRTADDTLARRDAVLSAVASSAQRLLRASAWEDAIADVLRELGEAADVSRAYVFRVDEDSSGRHRIRQLHEWAAPGSSSQLDNPLLQDHVPAGTEADWMQTLARGEIVQGHARDHDGPSRQIFESQGIISLVLVPVTVDERFWGFLGFDECVRERKWTAAESEALRAAAGALGAAIQRRLSEQARREVETRYRTLVEHLPLTTYIDVVDGDVPTIYISPQIEPILGYSTEEWLSDHTLFSRILHPDDRAGALEGEWPEDDGPHRHEYRVVSRDGREVWFLDEYTFVRDEDGNRLYAQGYMLDITGRRRMEEELRRTNEMLRTVVHASPLGIIVTDLDDVITFWNPAAERIYGWSGADVLGHRPPGRPAELEREYREFLEACERGEWIAGYETRRLRKDGTTIDVSISLAPLHDADGRLVGMLGVHEGITERKTSEEALREREEHFRAVFDNALDGVAILDDSRRFVEVNQALVRLHGRPREEFIGNLVEEFALPERRPAVPELWDSFMEAGLHVGETEIERPDGTRRQLEYTFRANFLEGRHLVVARDITERKELESQLLQSQRLEAVGRLAGGVAHDFNNLLTAISGYSEFLLDALDANDPHRRDVDEIARAADRAAALVRQLLAFSRRQMMRPRVVDLNEVIADTETLLRRLIGEDVRLVTHLHPALPPIRADPAQLEQIVVNLAVNARDAMPVGGTLSIDTENGDAAHTVRLTVTDTGVGMDPETAEHAFEPFFTTKEPGKGTGLGLSTVYGIVTQSGGTVELRSERGLGTTFTITLPALEHDAVPASAGGLTTGPRRGSETLLLVEDEAFVRDLAERVLGSAGYTVLSAASGEEALRVAEAFDGEIALVVTDVVMPGMSGRELVDRLLATWPGLSVLYTSGYGDDATFAHGGGPGAFIGKPFTPESLRQKVAAVLDAVESSDRQRGRQA